MEKNIKNKKDKISSEGFPLPRLEDISSSIVYSVVGILGKFDDTIDYIKEQKKRVKFLLEQKNKYSKKNEHFLEKVLQITGSVLDKLNELFQLLDESKKQKDFLVEENQGDDNDFKL